MTTRRTRGRGGKGGSEPPGRIRLREVRAAQLDLEGYSQHAIARELGISQPAVSKMLKRIADRLLADVAWEVSRHRARQTLRLEFIYAQAIRAWKDSQQDSQRKRQRRTEAGKGSNATSVAELVSENRHGDPRFLDEARRALADLRAIWGVDAPERVSVETNPFAAMTDQALQAEVVRQGDFLRRFLPQSTATVPPQTTGAADEAS